MNMKKILRSGLAIICSASMVLSCFGMIAPTVNAAEAMPTGFTDVTPKDFGIADFSNNTEMTKYTSSLEPITSVAGVKFSSEVVFGYNSTIYYCDPFAEGYSGGIGLWTHRAGNNMRLYNYAASWGVYVGGEFVGEGTQAVYEGGTYHDARFFDFTPNYLTGTNTFDTTEVLFQMTTEVVDFDKDGQTNDLKIGLWFDGKLQDDAYIYLRNCTVADKPYLSMVVKSCTSPEIFSKEYTKVTPKEFGIDNISNNTGLTKYESTLKPIDSINKKTLSANVVLGYGATIYYCEPFATGYGGGIGLWTHRAGNNMRFYNYAASWGVYVGGEFVGEGTQATYQGGTYHDARFFDFTPNYLTSTNTFDTTEVLFQMTTEVVDFDKDGQGNDLKIGLWFDGKLQDDAYIYLRNCTVADKPYLSMAVKSYTSPGTPTEPPVDPPVDPPVNPPAQETVYADITPSMLGIPDTTDAVNGVTLTTPTESVKEYNLDKTKFSAKVHFFGGTKNNDFTYMYNTAGRGQLYFRVIPGASSSLLLYNCRLDGDTTLYVGEKYVSGADIAGYKQIANNDSSAYYILGSSKGFNFIGGECLITITTEFIDFDGDGNANDLEICVRINGESFDPIYCYYRNYTETTYQGILSTNNLIAIESPTVDNPATPVQPTTPPGPIDPDNPDGPGGSDEPQEETLPTDFTKVSPNFFDIDDFKDNVEDPITYQDTKSPFASADKVMLYTDVVFGSGRTIEYLYNGATGSGIYLWGKENLHVRNYMSPSGSAGMYIGGEFVNGEYKNGSFISGRHDNYVIQASKLSSTENFDTMKVKLILTTQFVDFDGEGKANDLKLGVWIDGKLYDNTYIYMRNCLDVYTPALKMNVVEMSSPISASSGEPEDTVPTLPEITFSDFGVDNGVYGHDKEKPKDFAISGTYYGGFADQTFVGTVNFTDQPATCIGFAGRTSAWQGVRITSRGDGNLSFVDANGQFPSVVIYEKLAKTKLTDCNVEIGLTFEIVDLDKDGKKDDVRFWLTLNGVLYRNKPIVKAIDYAQYLGKFLGIYSDHEESTVKVVSKKINRPKAQVDFAMMGFDEDWAKTLSSGSRTMTVGVSTNKAPNTGDNVTTANYFFIGILALVVIGGVSYSTRYGKKETDE